MERRYFGSKSEEEHAMEASDQRDFEDDEDANDNALVDDVSPFEAPSTVKPRANSVIDSAGANDALFSTPRRKKSQMMDNQTSKDESLPATPSDSSKASRKRADTVDVAAFVNPIAYSTSVLPSTSAVRLPVHKDALYYNMNHKNRGKCVIFNHTEFDTGSKPREGSSADAERIESTFKDLGFTVDICNDFCFGEIQDKITELTEEDHRDNDCLCVFVLTHGVSSDLIASKDVYYNSETVWKPFTADKCVTLAGKPKLFFFQACRGDQLDSGIQVCSTFERTATDSSDASYKIPTHADFLIAHSTVTGFLSWRNPEEGTWYVQCLCDVIEEHWRSTDLLNMLTMTAHKVATEYTSFDDQDPRKHEQTQVPSMTSMLIRRVLFTPKQHKELF